MLTAKEAKDISNEALTRINMDFITNNKESNEILLTYLYEEIRISCEQGFYSCSFEMDKILSFYNGIFTNEKMPLGFEPLFRVVLTDLENNNFRVTKNENLVIDWDR